MNNVMFGLIGLSGKEILLILGVVLVMAAAGLIALVLWGLWQLVKQRKSPSVVPPVQSPSATPPPSQTCPKCGAPLPAGAPQGLCPRCVLGVGLATHTDAPGAEAGPGGTQVVPPKPEPPPPLDEIARQFPQLEVLECLGRGGMGVVYKARQPRLNRIVALKILAREKEKDPRFAERFTREAQALARLNHPNIVAVYDFGETNGLYYLLMEFVDGMSLRQLLQSRKLAPEEALAIVPSICEALQYAHQLGIVHRDIKPENILMDKQGRVKIADYGIAKLVGADGPAGSLTGEQGVVGTPHYMAPEQVEKPSIVDHRADIFSLGVVFYEMLTGELPLGKFAPPSRMVKVDVRLDEVVLHALEKEPDRRYQHASQVKTAVETITGTPPQFTAAPAGKPIASPGIITAPAVALMVAALWKLLSVFSALLLLAGGSGWMSKFFGFGNLFGGWGSVAILSIVLFKLIPGLLILFGGFQMLQRRSYAWAIAAAIISIVACSLLGFPIGIWALIVLARDDVRSAFGSPVPAAPRTPPTDRFWRRFAVVIACVILIPIAIAIIGLLAAIAIPNFVKARKHAQELIAPQLQQAGIHQEAGEFRKDSSQSFPLNADGRFSIDNIKGRIDIHGWSSNVVVLNAAIHGKTSESVEAVKISVDSGLDRVSVHTEQPSSVTGFPWSWLWFKNDKRNDASVDYTIQVPQRARLANISSVNGRIVIDGVSGNIAASTVNGEMQIKNAARNLKLSTVNGSITADMIMLGGRQSVSLAAVNGGVELVLPGDADANFSVSTVNGSITSEFPSLKAKKELPVGNNLKGSLGNGSATVKATAVNGTIKILKRQTAEQTLTNTPAEAGEPVASGLEIQTLDETVKRGCQAELSGDYSKAFRILLPAARQGHPIAQHRIGVMHTHGLGVEQDFAEATRWFRKAAEQGQGESQFSLGLRYFEGQSVAQDDTEAARWFRLAADQGVGMAASMLAQLYAWGRGVPQEDLVEAYKWLAVAGGQIEPNRVTVTLNDLENKLTPDQLAEAQRRAKEFVPKRTGPADP